MSIRSPLSLVERSDQNMEGRRASGKNEDILAEVRKRLDESYVFEQDNREDMASDLRYLAGDQWPDQVRRLREEAGRPMLTINRMRQFLSQVTNPIRQADMTIKVAPVDDFDDKELAKIYNTILQQLQYRSSADQVYCQAAENQAACGIGYFRIATKYTNNSSFDQEIVIEPVLNPLSVYDDPSARKVDRSDAMWRMVVEEWPTQHFRDKYPDLSPSGIDVPTDITDAGFFWADADTVAVAEYWKKTPVKKRIAQLDNGKVIDITDMDRNIVASLGVVNEREVEDFKVEQYWVSGTAVLEGPTEWPGNQIPIVPVIGTEVPMEKKLYRHGILRFARDPQQLYNYYRTASAEAIALRPKAPYLVTAGMIERHKSQWDTLNTSNTTYLVYDADPNAPGAKPYREPPPEMPAAFMQEAQIAESDMKGTTGIYDSSLGAQAQETSGIAIGRRQQQGDTATYHYQDNLKTSLEHAGRILIDLIPKIYDSERAIRIDGDGDEKEETLQINQVVMGMDGEPVVKNDLSVARFDIRVNIAPSAQTKRIETANSLFEFARNFPQAQPLVADLVAKYSDWPGAESIAKRLKNMVPPEALYDPEDPEAPQPPDPMQDPTVQLQLAELQKKIEQLEVGNQKTQADTGKVIADTAKSEAETLQTQIENALMKMQTARGWHPDQQQPVSPQQEFALKARQQEQKQQDGWNRGR